MKTRVKLGQVGCSLLFCLALTSCNKEGFFEKEYLADPGAAQTTSGTDNGGQDGGIDAGVDGGTQGGVDSGVDGGTDGSATDGSATGGTDGSTTTGGTTGGSTVGGTDGSTTTTTGGATNGSTVGGATTGSTVGGTTGSTTGGTTGVSYQDVSENFQQSAAQTKQLDVLWIVDNSGSMADEQDSLGRNFDAFINDFIDQNVDFKMAITTTDVSSSSRRGRMVTGSDTKLTSAKAKQNEVQFMSDFKELVKVGISGSGYEKGLEASYWFMDKHAASWMRRDAYLAVVMISDEEDQSPESVLSYWNNLIGFKANPGLVKIYTIVDTTNSNTGGNGVTTGHARYAAMANASAGTVADIREDFADVLADMGASIINLLDSFALANTPVAGTLKVFVNDVETTSFSFDGPSRSIKFDQGQIPPVGATIRVTYKK